MSAARKLIVPERKPLIVRRPRFNPIPPHIWVPKPLQMAVAPDAAGTAQIHLGAAPGSSPFNDTSLTIGAISNGLLAVVAFIDAAHTGSISGMTWNGVALTQTAHANNASASSGGATADIWTLLNPATGAHTLAVSFTNTGGFSVDLKFIARSYSGVNQTGGATSFPHTLQTTGNTNSAGGTLASATGNYTIGGAITEATSLTAANTSLMNDTQDVINVSAQEATGAASVSMTWSLSATDQWAAVGIDIAAAGGGGGFTPKSRRLMTPAGRVGSRQAHGVE